MQLGKIISNSFRQTFIHFKVWLWSFLSTLLGSSFDFQPHNSLLDTKIYIYYSSIFVVLLYLSVFGSQYSIDFETILVIQIITFIFFLFIIISQALGSYTKIKLIHHITETKKAISSNQILGVLLLRLLTFSFSTILFLPIIHFIISFFPQLPNLENQELAILLILVIIIPLVILYLLLMTILGFVLQNLEIILSLRSVRITTAFKIFFRIIQKHFFFYLLSWLSIFSIFLIVDIFLRFSLNFFLLFFIMIISLFTALSPTIAIILTILIAGILYIFFLIIGTIINSFFTSYWSLSINNHLKKLTK